MDRYRRMYGGSMGNPMGGMPRGRNANPCRQNDNCGCNDNVGRCAPEEVYDDCSCGRGEGVRCERENFDRFPIGMCYVPWQCFRDLYEDEFKAIARGTIFKELDLEFCGRSCK